MKSRRTNATDIPMKVKKIVWERDNHCCIVCGSPYAKPEAHYIPRSHGGLGIEQNIVTLCRTCHSRQHDTDKGTLILALIKAYLKRHYEGWNELDLYFRKDNR